MSSSKTLPILATLGLAAAGGAAWLLIEITSGGGETPAGPAGDGASVALQPEAGGGEAPAPDDAAEPGLAAGPAAPGAAEPGTERTEAPSTVAARVSEDQRRVEGLVALPQGLPADERVLVLALEGAQSARELYSKDGPIQRAWAGDEEDSDEGLLAVTEADPEGHFAIVLPEGSASAHLALAGRYLLGQTTVEVRPGDRDVWLRGELGARISGRLVAPPDHSGGLDELEIELGPDLGSGFETFELASRAVRRRGATDGEGAFELRALPTGLSLGLLVRPEELATAMERGLELEPGEHRVVNLRLSRGAELSGVARDSNGKPVAEAKVSARLRGLIGQIMDELREVETDEEGRFVLSAVTPGGVHLEGRAEGFKDAELRLDPDLAEGERRADLVLVFEAGSSIRGRVTFPGGEAAVGCSVRVSGEMGAMGGLSPDLDRTRTTTTGEDGRFSISGLSGTSYRVAVALAVEDGDRAGTWKARKASVRPDGDELAIVLDEPVTLRGQVASSPSGAPLAEFEVSAKLKGSGMMFDIGAERLSRGFSERVDGRFEMDDLREGKWELVVRAPGHGSSGAVEVDLPTADSAPPVEFLLPLAGTVSGRVIDPGGLPVAGALVRPTVDLAARIEQAEGSGGQEAITDNEGSFRLDGLDPGSIDLVARREGHAASEAATADVVAGEEVGDVTLELRRGGKLTGEVLDGEGEPRVDAMVVVQLMPTYTSQHIVRTDAAGAFAVEHLEPGTWQVVVPPNMFGAEDRPGAGEGSGDEMSNLLDNLQFEVIDMVEGGTEHVVLGRPPEDPVEVTCTVVHAGDPVTGAIVSMIPDGVAGISGIKLKLTDSEGTVKVQLDRPGPYHVTVQLGAPPAEQNSIEFLREVPEGVEQHSMKLEMPGGRISGRVEDSDGNPLAECRVTLHVDGGIRSESFYGGHYTETRTDAEGRYDIRYLDAGVYSVAAGGLPLGGLLGGEPVGGRQLRSGLRVSDGQWVEGVDFSVVEPASLTGVVRDVDGQTVTGASVFVRDGEGRLVERFSPTTTGPNGQFKVRGLAPGTYTVAARIGERASSDSPPVRVRAGESEEAAVTLESGTVLRVALVDGQGETIHGILSVLDEEGREFAGMLSLSEVMQEYGKGLSVEERRVGPLPPGRYTISARAGSFSAEKPVSLNGQPERKVRLRLR